MFAEQLAEAGPRLLSTVLEAARLLLDKPAERSVAQQRRDTLQALMSHGEEWVRPPGRVAARCRRVADQRRRRSTGALVASMQGHTQKLMLVDDATVQKEIFVSRLSQAIVDLAVWELNDLGTRISALHSKACATRWSTCSGRSNWPRSSCARSSTAISGRTPGPASSRR